MSRCEVCGRVEHTAGCLAWTRGYPWSRRECDAFAAGRAEERAACRDDLLREADRHFVGVAGLLRNMAERLERGVHVGGRDGDE